MTPLDEKASVGGRDPGESAFPIEVDLNGGPGFGWRDGIILALILVAGSIVRTVDLGRLNFWYDEVVTIRLASTPGPAELVELLKRIDAARAPLHPLILQFWVDAFGDSEASARSLSALFGIATVLALFRLGRLIHHDTETGLWAAFLGAISPLLIVYSREARMYALLVWITCLTWTSLYRIQVANPRERSGGRLIPLSIGLILLIYSHPLGLIMAGTIGVGAVAMGIGWKPLLGAAVVVGVSVAPWIGHYFDHPPESTAGRLPLRFLFGTPIGFLGGNFVTLALAFVLIGYGLLRFSREKPRLLFDNPAAAKGLLLWLFVPPLVLYGYSLFSHPIFGPARYTLYVAPAFLLLIARGLARSPGIVKALGGLACFVLAATLWSTLIFAPDLKADWRAASLFLDQLDPSKQAEVYVVGTEGGSNVEVETARYYLGENRPIFPFKDRAGGFEKPVWVAVGRRGGQDTAIVPEPIRISNIAIDFEGLRLYRTRASANP